MRFIASAFIIASTFRVGCECGADAPRPPAITDGGAGTDGGDGTDGGAGTADAGLLVVSPAAGDILGGGQRRRVEWTGAEPDAAVQLTLEDGDGGATPIVDPAESWTVPLLDGEAFQIRVTTRSSSAVSGAFVIDSTAPKVTVLAPDAGTVLVPSLATTIRWAAVDARLATAPIRLDVSWDVGVWGALAVDEPNDGQFDWTPGRSAPRVRLRVRAVDVAGNEGLTESEDLVVDDSPPLFTPGTFRLAQGAPTTASPFVSVDLDVRDDGSPITAYCLKYDVRAAPAPGDPCWVTVAPTPVLNQPLPFRLGFIAKSYDVFAWAQNAIGLVSALGAGGLGAAGTETASIQYQPRPPPDLTRVVASATPAGAVQTLPLNAPVFIRWRATSATALTVSLFWTSDEVNFTPIAQNLANGAGAGCQLTGQDTGCFRWTSPASSYLRVRVGATDTTGRTSFRSTAPLNVESILRVIAGSTDPGTGGSAEAAVFTTQNAASSFTFPQSFVVTERGVVYFNDLTRGILEIDPFDGVQRLVVPRVAVSDGGVLVQQPMRLFADAQDRVLIFDGALIKRYDPRARSLVTLIGGGASTAPTLAPRALNIRNPNPTSTSLLLFSTPNGNIYFQTSSGIVPFTSNPLRVYEPSDGGLVTTLALVGDGDALDAGQELAQCNVQHLAATFDPVSSQLGRVLASIVHITPGCPGPPGSSAYFARFDGTGRNQPPHPINSDEFAGYSVGANGALYRANRRRNLIARYDDAPDAGPEQFVVIAGSGTNGSCADGTPALSCELDVSDVWATRSGQVYLLDRGRIRTIDQQGRVYTLMGLPLFAGDGLDAREARIGQPFDVKVWSDGGTDTVIFYDGTQFRFREFAIGGTIRTIAGTGREGVPLTSLPADSQPISYNLNGGINEVYFQVNAATGDVYTNRGSSIVARLGRVENRWVDLAGGGNTLYWAAAAENAPGASIDFTSNYSPKVIGSDGASTLLVYKVRWNGFASADGFYKVLELGTDGGTTLRTLAGATGLVPPNLPADGTSVLQPVAEQTTSASWDASRWLLLNPNQSSAIRTTTDGGTWTTFVTMPLNIQSFVRRPMPERLFVCQLNGVLAEANVATGLPLALPWPVPRMRCTGKSLVSLPARGSLLVPVAQDGVGAIIEYFVP